MHSVVNHSEFTITGDIVKYIVDSEKKKLFTQNIGQLFGEIYWLIAFICLEFCFGFLIDFFVNSEATIPKYISFFRLLLSTKSLSTFS